MGCQCQEHKSKDEVPGVAYVCIVLAIIFWVLAIWCAYAYIATWTLLPLVGLVVFAVTAWVTSKIAVDIVRQYNYQFGRSKKK
jgi:hypothetical protein